MSKERVLIPSWLKRRRDEEAFRRAFENVRAELVRHDREKRHSNRAGRSLSVHPDNGRKAHQAKMRVKRHKANKAARKARRMNRAA